MFLEVKVGYQGLLGDIHYKRGLPVWHRMNRRRHWYCRNGIGGNGKCPRHHRDGLREVFNDCSVASLVAQEGSYGLKGLHKTLCGVSLVLPEVYMRVLEWYLRLYGWYQRLREVFRHHQGGIRGSGRFSTTAQ